jgi:hypothetical protein
VECPDCSLKCVECPDCSLKSTCLQIAECIIQSINSTLHHENKRFFFKLIQQLESFFYVTLCKGQWSHIIVYEVPISQKDKKNLCFLKYFWINKYLLNYNETCLSQTPNKSEFCINYYE